MARKEVVPERLFLETIEKLIKNLIVEPKNWGHTQSSYGLTTYDVTREIQKRGRYVLEQMEELKHLINLDENNNLIDLEKENGRT